VKDPGWEIGLTQVRNEGVAMIQIELHEWMLSDVDIGMKHKYVSIFPVEVFERTASAPFRQQSQPRIS
jgi:hypothetical protein